VDHSANCGCSQCKRGPRRPEVWYDGLRTRYGYRPESSRR
jgi:hypothetical protein